MDDLLYLKHTTTFDNLFGILDSGKIYTGVDMWYNDLESKGGFTTGGWGPDATPEQYPGVYMNLINRDLIGKDIKYWSKDDVQLIFCISLLNRGDFHYNYVDSNGYLNKDITSLRNALSTNTTTQTIDRQSGQVVTRANAGNRRAFESQLKIAQQSRDTITSRIDALNDSITNLDIQIL